MTILFGEGKRDFCRRSKWEDIPHDLDFIEWCADGLSVVTDTNGEKYLHIDAEGGYASTLLNIEKLKKWLSDGKF